MAIAKLLPHGELLAEEYVLVPAWKKAHDYIRHHNWYSDVLECDLTNTDLEQRLTAIAETIRSPDPLVSEPLRLVLAPKSQKWDIKDGQWLPVAGPAAVAKKLRPLAHVSVRDQIIATAFMIMCADTFETRQGDPRASAKEARARKMVSYGHRLFCDAEGGILRYRWGNSVVYRQYFQDYQAFIARPQEIIESVFDSSNDWAVIHADLSQFYDRVRPATLHAKVANLLHNTADSALIAKFTTFFQWGWHASDSKEAMSYAAGADPAIPGFESISLPQGLVASGFFSNAVLIDFDEAIAGKFDQWFDDGSWQLIDYCRYVDDMRLVIRLGPALINASDEQVRDKVTSHLTQLLTEQAPGLAMNHKKCSAVLGRNSRAGQIPVSGTMKRINHNASGVMDLFTGEETVELIEGLFLSRQEDPLVLEEKHRETFLAATPDVRDETVARFAANRFRRTFRLLRPLCEDDPSTSDESLMPALSRRSLDQKATIFCRRLVERWIRDPSNVRLLRVALDLRPDVKVLDVVLDQLSQYMGAGKRRKAPRRVAWYCAAEILKAGATETGLVTDPDLLPSDIDLKKYQDRLADFAQSIIALRNTYPWYLEQQAFLFLACVGRYQDRRIPTASTSSLRDYVRLHHALAARPDRLRREDLVPFSLLQKHLAGVDPGAKTFMHGFRVSGTTTQRRLLLRVIQEDPALAEAIWLAMTADLKEAWKHLFVAHGTGADGGFPQSAETLPTTDTSYQLLSLARSPLNPFRQEYIAIHFALALLQQLQGGMDDVFPSRMKVTAKNWRALISDSFPIPRDSIAIEFEGFAESDIRFALPTWVIAEPASRWKYQLGQILRVMLTGQVDFTAPAPRPHRDRSTVLYTPYSSSWLRRRYGLFNGRNAFGPAWLPISSWFGSLLSRLLEWPGFARFDFDFELADGFDPQALTHLLQGRLDYLERLYGRASYTPILPVRVPKAFMRPRALAASHESIYAMRVGVVQTVIPGKSSFDGDPQLNVPGTRQRHRRHLSAVLGAVHRMLQVRETHRSDGAGVELLVLPELAVHPDDIRTHLHPFVLQHRCIVCTGLVFHPVVPGGPIINSGYWLVPVSTPRGGLRVEPIEQGKWNLTAGEVALGITSFRPVQWILEIVDPATLVKQWSMTAAICYDATDLCLAADLRNITDMFVVPALNPDVGTFDNMVAALHYHMFQHVIVSNCGQFGGSTGQAPFDDRHRRTIFHSHGNEQVSVSFFEIDLSMYRTPVAAPAVGAPATAVPPAPVRPMLKTPPAGYARHNNGAP